MWGRHRCKKICVFSSDIVSPPGLIIAVIKHQNLILRQLRKLVGINTTGCIRSGHKIEAFSVMRAP